MGTISLSLPSDGQTIDAADVNTPLNTISAVINGNLDDDNIKVGANINGTKLLINSIPPTAGDANMRGGWNNGIVTAMPTVTALGNRSYSLVHATTDLTGYLSPGMRLKLTRTATAPTQCTSLNGTTQYYNKATPTGITFTDNFTVSAWVKASAYQAGVIMTRSDAALNNGWRLSLDSNGAVVLLGINTANANNRQFLSYQSIPLNKWVHIAASWATGVGVIYIDGVSVPFTTTTAGTAPTTITQGTGDLAIGRNAGVANNFFAGKIAQAAVYNAVISGATILAAQAQTLSGSETSLISAYSFNNSINDLNANANNLTANGSAVATTLDTPFTQTMTGVTTGTTNYGIITAASFSTNTTLTVQVAEGDTIPTSGGVSAMSYSTQKTPYGFPTLKTKWKIESIYLNGGAKSSPAAATYYNVLSGNTSQTTGDISVPIGSWRLEYRSSLTINRAAASTAETWSGFSTTYNGTQDVSSQQQTRLTAGAVIASELKTPVSSFIDIDLTTTTGYWLTAYNDTGGTSIGYSGYTKIVADNSYL